MQNEEGEKVDLYIPRKCSATNRLITANDHACVQVNIGHVNANGVLVPGEFTSFILSGYIRQKGESDDALNKLAQKAGFIKHVVDGYE